MFNTRFDLVLILLDNPNKEWDKLVSTFLLQQAVLSKRESQRFSNERSGQSDDYTHESLLHGPWSVSLLSQYINYVKHKFQPSLSPEAKTLLVRFSLEIYKLSQLFCSKLRYYQMQRQSDSGSSGRTTVRLLESLMRLSQAHAKIMMRTEVNLDDAVVAVYCMSLSQFQVSILGNMIDC
jgi:DNA helicase MCM9